MSKVSQIQIAASVYGRIGGRARMKKLGKKGRSELGKKAVQARWARYKAK